MLRDLDGNSFATGCAVFADTDLTESSPKIYVRIHPRNLPAPVLAQLDTGAAWSVLNVEIARRIGALDAEGEPLGLSTRAGKVMGKLGESAQETGTAITLAATYSLKPPDGATKGSRATTALLTTRGAAAGCSRAAYSPRR